MTPDELYAQIYVEKPEVIHVSGKTCVGKSTFANKLHDHLGYEIIELDEIVFNVVIAPQNLDEKITFVEVYKNNQRRDLIDPFVYATKQLIAAKATENQPIVIDGAVANTGTLAEIFSDTPGFTFAYFHPKSLAAYQRNLTSRFMLTTKDFSAGLPKRFWDLIDNKAFEQFCKDKNMTPLLESSTRRYAESSQKESEKRLVAFQEKFASVITVNI